MTLSHQAIQLRRKKGFKTFRQDVANCSVTSRTTTVLLLRRAVKDYGLPPEYIQSNIPATARTIRRWLNGESTPQGEGLRQSIRNLLLDFVMDRSLGHPACHYIKLRKAISNGNGEDEHTFQQHLQEAKRLGCQLQEFARITEVPYATVQDMLEGRPSTIAERQKLTRELLGTWLWNFAN